MRIVYVIGLLGLAGVGLWLNWASHWGRGTAAITMVEKDGRLVPASATPAPERIEVPQRPLNDGASEPWLTRFVLTERSGRKMGSEELRGQPYVAGFFFTTCPSICVRQNGRIKELQEEFRGQPVRFVSISCDPEIDTPEVLTQYAERFDADPEQWLFFTGDMKYIRRVGSEFFWLPVERRGHPERFALVDAEGKVFGLYQWSDDVQWAGLRRDIARLIEAGGVLPDQTPTDGERPPQPTSLPGKGETSSADEADPGDATGNAVDVAVGQ